LGPQPISTGIRSASRSEKTEPSTFGIIADASGIGPGTKTGSVRRITFTDGKPNPPETISSHLQFPDGIGLWPRP
jgi:hypothetical protein